MATQSQTSSEMLFHDMRSPSRHQDDDEGSELNLDLLNASDQNIKIEMNKKRKFCVKAEPHCITDQEFTSYQPPAKRARIDINSKSTSSSNSVNPLPATNTASQQMLPTPTPANLPPYLVPVQMAQHPQYYVPLVAQQQLPPHHRPLPLGNYGHPMAMQSYLPRRGPFYGPTRVGPGGRSNTRRRRAPEYEASSDESSDEDSQGFQDKSPFKTTYISRDEEKELKNANAALYSQFHIGRQSIFQAFKQKVDGIRHSAMLSVEKRKLNVKIAAIDAKVQEKKMFLGYLEMTKPQPTSWVVSSGTPHIMAYGRTVDASTDPTAPTNSTATATATANTTSSTADVDKSKSVGRREKKPKFSDYNVRVLRDWYETHSNNPYPSAAEKHLMCQLTGLTKYQVSRWFCNVRTRKPPPELSDNDEDVAAQQNHSRKPRKVKTGNRMIGDYYGRTAAPHMAPYGVHQHQQMRMPAMGFAPMNFRGMHPMNTVQQGMSANPHFGFQQLMSQKRMNAVPNMNGATPLIAKEKSPQGAHGLMPEISPNEISPNEAKPQNVVLLPPPLIDENSNVSKQS